ncbi:MAG: 5-formyltetrahydrofolate cyclo-ligase [bacterium]
MIVTIMQNPKEEKKAIRRRILNERNSMDRSEIAKRSEEIARKLISSPEFESAGVVMVFVSFGSEVRTQRILNAALSSGKRVAVPLVQDKKIIASELLDPENDLAPGTYGILEPKPECVRPVPAEEIDLIVTPGLAFDRRGYRIGYGAGYYDRFFKTTRPDAPKIAVAFDFQVLDEVPTTERDLPVDAIITERRIIICNRRGK